MIITTANITAEGFVAEQFGKEAIADWPAFTLAVIVIAAAKLAVRVGAVNYASYATLDSSLQVTMARVELCYAAADLLRRRINRVDAEKRIGMDGKRSLVDDYKLQRQQYMDEAEELVVSMIPSLPAKVAVVTEAATSQAGFGVVLSSTFGAV